METRIRLLVVDDDAATLQTLTHLLQHFGFDVVSEKRPESAAAILAEQNDIAVLICDYEMPGMDGEQLARRAKQLNANMPVFIFSGTNPPVVEKVPWDGWFLKGIAITHLITKLNTFRPGQRGCEINSGERNDGTRSDCRAC